MQIELPVFKKAYRPKSSKLTDLLAAFSQFLDAQRQGASHRYDDAEKSLQRAIQIDPQFATALWALAELRELKGDGQEAGRLRVQASHLNPDHPQLSVLPGEETRPVQAIFNSSSKNKTSH